MLLKDAFWHQVGSFVIKKKKKVPTTNKVHIHVIRNHWPLHKQLYLKCLFKKLC